MNVLAIGAHFDDLELGCSGTLIKHRQRGDEVTMLVITDSSYHNPTGDLVRDRTIAREEGERAAALVGARLICLDFDTFMVPNDEKLTKTLNHHLDTLSVDIVYSHWVHDLHRDHQFAARAALMAGRHVPRFLMYRSNYYDTEQQFRGNFYSDISDAMDRKIEVILAHKSELERVRYRWLDFFKNQNANDGQKIGVGFAECFEVVRYLW